MMVKVNTNLTGTLTHVLKYSFCSIALIILIFYMLDQTWAIVISLGDFELFDGLVVVDRAFIMEANLVEIY